MPKVDWESTYATWAAVARRRGVRRQGKALGGINIATFFWTDGSSTYATTRWSESPLGTGSNEVAHSEEVIWGEIKNKCVTIYWVFTERAPCPPPPVGRGCSVWLPQVLAKIGAKKEMTPIYWIYAYPDNSGGHYEGQMKNELLAIIPKGKDHLPVYWEQAGKAIRNEATLGLKGIDDYIEKAYGRNESANDAKAEIKRLKTAFKKDYTGAIIDMP